MKKLKSHFRFNKQERSGIFFLLSIIFVLQIGSYLIQSLEFDVEEESLSLNQNEQIRIDSLLAAAKTAKEARRSSFNPNYISDFKGYELGMSVEEIDRLHHFRASGKYIYSSEQFQMITHVPDTLLQKLSPYFRFPKKPLSDKDANKTSYSNQSSVNMNTSKKDLNNASEEDLKMIYGIGDILSARIVKYAPDQRLQLYQQVQAAVYVADRIDPVTGRNRRVFAGSEHGSGPRIPLKIKLFLTIPLIP